MITSGTCNARKVDDDPNKIICVCDENACEDLRFKWPELPGQVYLIESTLSGKRFKVSDISSSQAEQNPSIDDEILVSLNEEKQYILGWGGAFTDATGFNLRNLSARLADELLQSYFGIHGLQYNIARVPIGGTDFSVRAYTYNDSPEADLEQKNWSLAEEDTQWKIPFIKRAIQIAKDQTNTNLKLFASSWSAPKWLKDNNSLIRGSLIDRDEIYRSYTKYLMNFFDSYENRGVRFWGATVQNEPVSSGLPFYFFNSMNYHEDDQMAKVISDYLGPALQERGMTKDKFKLMVGDDSLGFINKQVPSIMSKPEVSKYVSGLAFHWYTSGSVVPYDALNKVYEPLKDKFEFVLMTEACEGSTPLAKKVDLGSWSRGESYANDIIEDLLRHTNGWIDWNMALDLGGGPNWSKNFVDSPIIVNGAKNEFYKQPMYYALAHFSRFFKPKSVRVETQIKASAIDVGLSAVAVHNKRTGHLVLNVLNKSFEEREITLIIDGAGPQASKVGPISIEANSINSIVMKL